MLKKSLSIDNYYRTWFEKYKAEMNQDSPWIATSLLLFLGSENLESLQSHCWYAFECVYNGAQLLTPLSDIVKPQKTYSKLVISETALLYLIIEVLR